MDQSDFNQDTLIEVLLDSVARAELIDSLLKETGFDLPLTNRFVEVAQRCRATSDQLRQAIFTLTADGAVPEHLIEPFVFHTDISEDVLFTLADRNLCISALGHRSGPFPLLEKLAEDHQHSEAITTLALECYGPDDENEEAFADFVAKYRNDEMLRWNLERSATLSNRMRAIGLAALKPD